MDPVTIGLGLFGLGMSIFGGLSQSHVAGQEAQVSQDEARQEQGINNAKQQAMEINAQRSQLENTRNIQRARAQGLNAAVNQGGQFGSGVQGGQAQATDQGLWNDLGISQALLTGRQINTFNQAISQDKIQMAGLQGQSATDQGIASLGGSLLKAAPFVGSIFKGWGGGSSSGGNYSGMPWSSNTGGLY